jgi:hypothetical protein
VSNTSAPPTVKASTPVAAPCKKARRSICSIEDLPMHVRRRCVPGLF